MTAIELLESLNLLDEQERIEAKRASEAGKSVLETVCAFANEPGMGGGWLALGIVREELALFPAYEVEGITNPEKISSDIANQCRDVFNIPLRVDISTENVQGKNVVVVFVPEAQSQDKPIFFKAQGLPRGALRRIGSTDQRCTDDDMSVFYQGRQQESFDAGIVADTSMDDLSLDAIDDYRKSRAQVNPDAEELRWSDEELLQAVGSTRRDQKGIWRFTVAGLILFGKSSSLRRCFPMTRVDYIRVPGREWVPDPDHRFDTVELRDPLFRLIRRAQAAGLLAQKGRGSATYYVPTERLGTDGRDLPTKLTTLPTNLQGLSTNPDLLSDNSEELPTNSTPEEEIARRALLAELPGDLAARVGALGRRSIPEEAQAVIVEVCRLRAWRPEELALLLHRNSRHVRTYLRPLTRDGRLVMTNPDEPNDPQQAYRTIATS